MTRTPHKLIRSVALFLAVLFIPLLSGCDDEEAEIFAAYGYYGANLAETLAKAQPYRAAYSGGEWETGEAIIAELQRLGYEVEIQEFGVGDTDTGRSRNLIVHIPGQGFFEPTPTPELTEDDPSRASGTSETTETNIYTQVDNRRRERLARRVIIGAHYDTPVGVEQAGAYPLFDGISDNSSSVAALVTFLREVRYHPFNYDIDVVFFGAGYDDWRGARTYLSGIAASDLDLIDAVYVVSSIYGGDKLYAHAGRNSLAAGDKYVMRRKLYEMTDVALEYNLSVNTGVDLLTNQAGFFVPVPSTGTSALYREWTLNDSDYLPFDEAGLPIVYIESGNYSAATLEDIKESTDPVFNATGGKVSGTNEDSSSTLQEKTGQGQLRKRINVTAFLLIGALDKGSIELEAVPLTPTPKPEFDPEDPGGFETAPAAETNASDRYQSELVGNEATVSTDVTTETGEIETDTSE